MLVAGATVCAQGRLDMKSKLSVALVAAGCALALNLGPAKADLIPTTTALSVSATSITFGDPWSATVTITAVGVADITGSVELLVNGSTFLTGNLGPPEPGDAVNAFIFFTTALPLGTDTVQPMYGGNEIYSLSFGNAVSVTVNAVPGPIAGAGLPGLILAAGGLVALARRRRQKIA
jgi:hypothetical protein